MKNDRKNQRRLTSNVVVRFFCMSTSAHARVRHLYEFDCRTSSIVVRVQVGDVCEVRTLAGVPGLAIVLDPACACQ